MKKLYQNRMITVAAIWIAITGATWGGKNVEPARTPIAPVDLPFYIGIGAVWSMTSLNCPCAKDQRRMYDSTNFGGILRVGYDFNPYFGVEARVLHSRISKLFAETTHYGLYLKPQYHITNAINVYGLAGYGHTYIETLCKSFSYDVNGFSFGAGFEYDFNALPHEQGDAETGWGLFVDYQNFAWDRGKQKTRSNIFSAGITYDF